MMRGTEVVTREVPQAGERAGSGAGTQAFGRDDATVRATCGGKQNQGLGMASMAAPRVIEGAVNHALGDQEAKR